MKESLSPRIAELIGDIAALPAKWHGVGSVDVDVLLAIARYAEGVGPIRHSVETGSGKTTLLFSHLSADHRVFAINEGESISQVRHSPLFRAESTTYIEGPTQATLQQYAFSDKVQIALIDGPHGYPFPDLEYFYLYPNIETGGLLIIDDILIPSIGRMFEVIKADDMFELVDVVSSNTALFKRTDAPLIDPYSDSWWLQGYNRPYYERIVKTADGAQPGWRTAYKPALRKALHAAADAAPQGLKDRIPARIKTRLWREM
jgi:hypothetical protein